MLRLDIDMAFASVTHITHNVNNGHVLRYVHANGALLFFVCVYVHVGKGLYYGRYNRAPSLSGWYSTVHNNGGNEWPLWVMCYRGARCHFEPQL